MNRIVCEASQRFQGWKRSGKDEADSGCHIDHDEGSREDSVPVRIVSKIRQEGIPGGHAGSFGESQDDARGDEIEKIRCYREY